MLPPFVKVMREVTNEEFYHTKFMASISYKMPESDKLDIQHRLAKEQALLKVPNNRD